MEIKQKDKNCANEKLKTKQFVIEQEQIIRS